MVAEQRRWGLGGGAEWVVVSWFRGGLGKTGHLEVGLGVGKEERGSPARLRREMRVSRLRNRGTALN
ncbi:hypothetical protein M0R45_014269 [Rubus argutus]|uniref:Uncharacterized protein n=1 Tax=Rubus argutus TaxID=59490 RepID=A0AAW1XNG9_RUBAR